MGALAIAGLVLGAFIAWRSDSAATLLIVSAVLLLLVLVGRDLVELHVSMHGIDIHAFRQLVDERIVRTTSSEARAELEELRSEVTATTDAPSFFGEAIRRRIAEIQAIAREAESDYRATHTQHGDRVILTLSAGAGHELVPSSCVVIDPDGHESSASVKTSFLGTISSHPQVWTVTFPRDFRRARAPKAGPYRVEWRTMSLLGIVKPTILAEDIFEYAP